MCIRDRANSLAIGGDKPGPLYTATIVRRNATSEAKSATHVTMYKSARKCPGMESEPGTRRGHPNPCATPLYTWKIQVISSANDSPSVSYTHLTLPTILRV